MEVTKKNKNFFYSLFFYFCALINGDIAQLVEQRTENPCVGGSIPPVTTNIFRKRFNEIIFSFSIATRSVD